MTSLRKPLIRLAARRDHAARQFRQEKDALANAEDATSHALQAQAIVQGVAEKAQVMAHRRVAAVVAKCLGAVFGRDAYEFELEFNRKRGKTEAKLVFKRDGLVLRDPTNEAGGGAVEVAAFALRVACLVMSKPARRKLLVLDEPFQSLKPFRVYGPRIRAMLESLAEETGIQFIVVQNVPEYQTGKVVEL